MATTFTDLVFELTGIYPGLSAFLAKRFINDAWRDILNVRTWSFLSGDGGFNAPVGIGAGTCSITIGSPTVTFDTTATTALNAVPLPAPTGLLARQFRLGTSGGVYNITGYVPATGTMTLDRVILEATGTGLTFQVYQCYFPPPPQALNADGSYDFDRWLSIVDPINGYVLWDDTGKVTLDRRDPQRSDVGGLAYTAYDYKSINDTPYMEFWPHPSGGQQYVCYWKRNGTAFTTSTQPLPKMIPSGLVINRALFRYADPWAQRNAGRIPTLKGINFGVLVAQAKAQYDIDLQAAKLQDDNIALQSFIIPNRPRSWSGPIDASFIGSHDFPLSNGGFRR